MTYDRNEVLDRVAIRDLCDELLGPRKGRGRAASWPCPEPRHGPQTGNTPPVTVFQPRQGAERWHCHGCGAGGTAIDLVMRTRGVGFPEAMDLLGRRTGAPEADSLRVASRPLRAVPDHVAARPVEPSPAVEAYVAVCQDWLWGNGGTVMRRWLARRGLGEEVLRANRVGADPGPRALRREEGLPRGGVAVVFPLLDDSGRAVYAQARYLRPKGRKYDNPSSGLVPASPRFGEVRTSDLVHDDGVVLVCEGIPDALTAVQAGWGAVAILGAGLPDEPLARALVERYPQERLVVAFDADHRGRSGAKRLVELSAGAGGAGRVVELAVPEEAGDLNGWAQHARERFPAELTDAIGALESPAWYADDWAPARSHPEGVRFGGPVGELAAKDRPSDIDDLLETLAYQHLLADDPAEVALAAGEVADAVSNWRSGADPLPDGSEAEPGTVGALLERVAYHGLLLDDPRGAASTLDRVETLDLAFPLALPSPAADGPGLGL